MQESVWNCSIQVALNQQKKPFDDKRVRRALTLALDRWNGSKALSRIAIVKEVSGIQVPGTPWATPPEELEKLAGYGRDINAARAEARRLLKEVGQENLTFTLTNRAVPMPYEPVGVWLIDQWRQIGVNVKQVNLESAAWFTAQKEGQHEVSTNAPCNSIPEPDLDLHWFLASSPVNYSRHRDTVLDDLYTRQSRTTDPAAAARVREAALRRGSALHPRPRVASHHPAPRQGAGLDDHAEPLSESAARRGVARGVDVVSATRAGSRARTSRFAPRSP